MRRDLDIDFDPSQIVLEPPDRSQLREMFRRYEFRALLNRIEDLEDAIPSAAPAPIHGVVVPWREGDLPRTDGLAGYAADGDRVALATGAEVVVAPKLRKYFLMFSMFYGYWILMFSLSSQALSDCNKWSCRCTRQLSPKSTSQLAAPLRYAMVTGQPALR